MSDDRIHPEVSPQEWADLVAAHLPSDEGQAPVLKIDTGLDEIPGEALERAAWWATIVGAAALVVIAWKASR